MAGSAPLAVHGTLAIALASCLGVSAGPVAPQAAPPSVPVSAPPQPAATRIELRVGAVLDMHFMLRAVAAGAPCPPLEGAAAAAERVRAIDRALGGSPLAWGLLEGTLAESADLASARAAFGRFPERRELPGAGPVELRTMAIELADALAALEPRFMAEAWPSRRAAIEAAREGIARGLLPHQAECFGFACGTMGISDPGLEVPVHLVTSVPPFGGVTHRRPGGKPGGTCIVGIADNSGTLLDEAVLHESLHALDAATAGHGTALDRLRSGLAAAGIQPRSRAARDVPHTLLFVEAGEAVRRFVDPAHVPYGEAKGYYAKVPEARDAVVATWGERLAGRLTEDDAIARIVAAAREAEAGQGPAGRASPEAPGAGVRVP